MNGTFSGDYSLRETDSPAEFRYVPDATPLTFTRPSGEVITLSEPFDSDGATTPRFLRVVRWLDPWASWKRAALVHDWLWEIRRRPGRQIGFFESNVILHEGCLASGLAPWKAWLVRRAVDLFGWWVWFQDRSRTGSHA